MSDSLDYAEKTQKGFKEKANHNKNESLISFIIILTSSLLAPLFITLGEGVFLSKIVPSILSVIAAGFTSWLQLRKPQKLWSLYRECQRLIEDQIIKYKFKIGDYHKSDSPDSLLAEKVAEIALNAHHQWTAVIPNPDTFNSTEKK